jgi:hypothetical protein
MAHTQNAFTYFAALARYAVSLSFFQVSLIPKKPAK